uniref:Uncharacterized protein n=1 Tax=Lotharella globosa TaxID=91324 RepID=A0A7S3Z9Z5_9EUKA|mmetsp:Transcript_20803/g.40192  ORF Transcript_20803/g.40192 Transcript_20803/m.40192 type:complete len:253 (+) Transcript_20803:30-788(+)
MRCLILGITALIALCVVFSFEPPAGRLERTMRRRLKGRRKKKVPPLATKHVDGILGDYVENWMKEDGDYNVKPETLIKSPTGDPAPLGPNRVSLSSIKRKPLENVLSYKITLSRRDARRRDKPLREFLGEEGIGAMSLRKITSNIRWLVRSITPMTTGHLLAALCRFSNFEQAFAIVVGKYVRDEVARKNLKSKLEEEFKWFYRKKLVKLPTPPSDRKAKLEKATRMNDRSRKRSVLEEAAAAEFDSWTDSH